MAKTLETRVNDKYSGKYYADLPPRASDWRIVIPSKIIQIIKVRSPEDPKTLHIDNSPKLGSRILCYDATTYHQSYDQEIREALAADPLDLEKRQIFTNHVELSITRLNRINLSDFKELFGNSDRAIIECYGTHFSIRPYTKQE